MDSPSRGRLDAGIPSSTHLLTGPDAEPPVTAASDHAAAASSTDAADPLRPGPLPPRTGLAEEGM